MKIITKIISIFAIFSVLLIAKPAKAFYLEVPQNVNNLFTAIKSGRALAQEGSTITSPPPTESSQPMPYPGTYQPPYTMPSSDTMSPPPQTMNQPYPMPPQDGSLPPYQPMQSQPGMMPPPGGQNMPNGTGQNYQDDGKQLEQMKRGMNQMSRQVKQFEKMIADAEKKGTAVPDEIKQNLAKLKTILESVQNAKSSEDLQSVDMGEMQELMHSLEDFRRNVMEAQQRMEGMKRGMRGMETGLKMFERQVVSLTKKGVIVPADIQEHIAKLKLVVEKVKVAKSFDEVQEDMESMQDLMENFDQDRQRLEMLARWPQTLKQINSQLTRLTRELARSKIIVTRLATKDIDLQSEYTAFTEAVNKLKGIRDDAVAKMAAGNSDDAFSALEEDFFGQMDDVWEYHKVIMTMSNLGRFTSEFKQGMTQANSTIKNLKRKKIDTADLETIMAQANEKGQEILALLKVKPVDTDAVTDALAELENIKQEFEATIDELTGAEESLPWEQGPQQFKDINLPQGFEKYVPQKETRAPKKIFIVHSN